jgi:hypothetical protein
VFSDDLVKSALELKEYQGIKYNTVAQNITGLISPGSSGVNHGEYIKDSALSTQLCSSGLAIGIAIDGVVVLLTVTIS